MSFTTARRALMLGIATLALAGTAQAQSSTTSSTSPTPEGTTIRNEASATYTDGTTTYTAANAFVEVTVGFKAGVSLPADGSQTPASGSAGNEYTFTATNSGNGDDTFAAAFTTSSANITITGYRIDGGAVLDAAGLASGLAALTVPMTGTVDVTVIYSVANVTGGTPEWIDATVNSGRDGATTDTHRLDITPASVAVTPDGDGVSKLPGTYTATYTVTNHSSLELTYTLTASSSNTAAATTGAITHGAGGTFAGGALTLPAGQSGTINVAYTIPSSALATATTDLELSATSTGTPSVTDAGTWALTVQRPTVVMTKEAWLDDRSAQIATPVQPGDWIQYKVIVRNDGNAAAQVITVTDTLPTEVTFDGASTTADAAGWVFTGTTATRVTAVLDTLATGGAGTARFFWIRVQVK